MYGLTTEEITNLGTGIGAVIIAVVSWFGIQWGKKKATPGEGSVEVAGAIVDASSLNTLAKSVDRLAAIGEDLLESEKRNRDLGHKGVDTGERLATEMRELRTEMRHLGDCMKK